MQAAPIERSGSGLVAFVIAGGFAGMAGCLLALYIRGMFPESAFWTEYEYYRSAFTPEQISRLLYNYGPNYLLFNPTAKKLPEFVTLFVEHVGKLLEFGDAGNMEDMVKASGYKDPPPAAQPDKSNAS